MPSKKAPLRKPATSRDELEAFVGSETSIKEIVEHATASFDRQPVDHVPDTLVAEAAQPAVDAASLPLKFNIDGTTQTALAASVTALQALTSPSDTQGVKDIADVVRKLNDEQNRISGTSAPLGGSEGGSPQPKTYNHA